MHAGSGRPPAGSGQLVPVTVVAELHHEVDPHTPVAIVVIVALPQGPVTVDGDLVVVAKVVSQHLEATTIKITAEWHAAVVGSPVVDNRPTGQIDHRLALVVMDSATGVAEIPVHLPIRAEEERVCRVVVLRLAGLGEQDLLAVRLVVTVDVSEDQHVG